MFVDTQEKVYLQKENKTIMRKGTETESGLDGESKGES